MTTRSLVRIALFAAIIAALGLLPKFDLPFAGGVPITAQTLGVMLAGVLLGPRQGAAAVLLVIFVVALGAPILAGGRGGLGVFAGPTVGFLLGWLPGAFVTGLVFHALPKRLPVGVSAAV
ncbi:biotin transporter BioY, partial [Microvirga makkahensis]